MLRTFSLAVVGFLLLGQHDLDPKLSTNVSDKTCPGLDSYPRRCHADRKDGTTNHPSPHPPDNPRTCQAKPKPYSLGAAGTPHETVNSSPTGMSPRCCCVCRGCLPPVNACFKVVKLESIDLNAFAQRPVTLGWRRSNSTKVGTGASLHAKHCASSGTWMHAPFNKI